MNNRIILNSGWKFFCKNNPLNNRAIKTGRKYKAEVPGTIHTDLLRNKLIPDPFFADNETSLQWISECDWGYETYFDSPDSFDETMPVTLFFEGLDTVAEVKFNGETAGFAENMFRSWRFRLDKPLKKKKNHLEVIFRSPVQWALAKEKNYGRLPVALRSERVFIRKAQYSFGWDWGPAFITSGIWKPVYIENGYENLVESACFNTLSAGKNHAEAEVSIFFSGRPDVSGSLNILLKDENDKLAVIQTAEINNVDFFKTTVQIKDPRLWYPAGLGTQPLYKLIIELIEEDRVTGYYERTVGIRKVELVREENGADTFRFKVNGIDLFIRGANWIPAHTFLPELRYNDYKNLILAAKNANMNMLRVWGGGIYENDVFYELCDENGLLVWQDFMFACAAYPENEAFISNINAEFVENINRLKNHPCIAVWCGNNENEWNWYKEQNRPFTEMPGHKIFSEIIPSLLEKLAPGSNYHISSPFGNEDDPNSQTSGNCHQWQIWSMWTDYTMVKEDNSLFVTEFGFQGPANVSTFNTVIPRSARSIQSPLFEFHNKQVEGNERLIRFLAAHLPLNTDYEDFIYLTQLNQGLALKTCLEHWRLNRPITNGAIIWQLNDCWPVASWSLIDSGKKTKMAYYFVKNAFNPVLAVFTGRNSGREVVIMNDSLYQVKGKLEIVSVSSGSGETRPLYTGKCKLEENSRLTVNFKADDEELNRSLLIVTLYSNDGHIITRNFFTPVPWKYLSLPAAGIKYEVKKDHIHLKASKVLCFIDAQAEGILPGERGVIMLPGETRKIKIENPGRKINGKKIQVRTLNDYLKKK